MSDTMRKDFDYVSMADYSADMAELSTTASAAITTLCEENRRMKDVIWGLVMAAGGKIEVPRMIDNRTHKLEIWRNEANDSTVFIASRDAGSTNE